MPLKRPNIPDATFVSGNDYLTTFKLTGADTYNVTVTFNGVPLRPMGNTTIVVLPSVTSGGQSTLTLVGNATVGSPVTFTLTAHDEFMNVQVYNEVELVRFCTFLDIFGSFFGPFQY